MLKDNRRIYKHIIWDWNGTLLDDVDIVIDAMNNLLKRRKLPLLDIEKYKDIFTFPVKDYYTRLGFDFNEEPFEKLAIEYISEFNSSNYQFKLHKGVEEVLKRVRNMNISQSILSASQEQELNEIVQKLNINKFIVKAAGLNDHYAISKVERGKELLVDLDLEPIDALLIGDTIHDYEVSRELGCDCLLVCNGHQCYEKLKWCNVDIINDILNVSDYLDGLALPGGNRKWNRYIKTYKKGGIPMDINKHRKVCSNKGPLG